MVVDSRSGGGPANGFTLHLGWLVRNAVLRGTGGADRGQIREEKAVTVCDHVGAHPLKESRHA
jgi:hypothetical protein